MLNRRLTNPIRPYLSAVAVAAVIGVLVFTIFFTYLSVEWIAFLGGVLAAAVLAEATRVSRAEWMLARRTAQMSDLKTKFDRDAALLKAAEATIAENKPRLQLIDEVIPTMVAFVDIEGRCRYHNHAFRDLLRLRPDQVNGRDMREILGHQVYQEIASFVRQSLDGHAVKYERLQKMPDGSIYKLAVEHIPQFGEGGKANGFFMVADDITDPADVATHAHPHAAEAADNQNLFLNSFAERVKDQRDAAVQIEAAIEKGEFRLLGQRIVPLAASAGGGEYNEILIRLREEEEGMMPPGAFFPLAEKLGMMSHLDRWVVQRVAERVSGQIKQKKWVEGSMLFINLAEDTIGDRGFTDYLRVIQLEYDLPGATLCFEIPSLALTKPSAKVAEFARSLNECGFHVALSGFGRDRITFDLIRGFRIDFLKIDGNVVLHILTDQVALAKVVGINQVAKKIGVKTVAEYVESEEITAKLKEIGIDFAQGFGISGPKPLDE